MARLHSRRIILVTGKEVTMKKRRIAKLYWLRFLKANERAGMRRAEAQLRTLGWSFSELKEMNDERRTNP